MQTGESEKENSERIVHNAYKIARNLEFLMLNVDIENKDGYNANIDNLIIKII